MLTEEAYCLKENGIVEERLSKDRGRRMAGFEAARKVKGSRPIYVAVSKGSYN